MKTWLLILTLFMGIAPFAHVRATNAVANSTSGPIFQVPDFSSLVRHQGPTVVNVRTFKVTSGELIDPAGSSRKQPSHPPIESGMGSGFIVAPNGVILTNHHVIAGAEKITVRFIDKREMPAQVVGFDPLTDIAVLKVEAQNLPYVALGNSSDLEVGQWVLAIGAPLGLERTATHGIISALGRTLPNDSYVPFIQTDVPINPGNSGGPLFDLEGRVVGINSQIMSKSGGSMGLSFAIPINIAIKVSQQILEHGHATHGWLGVSVQDLTMELTQAYGLEVPRGALVNEIRPEGPAYRAGLQTGDIILAFDNYAIADSAELPPIIGANLPDTEHSLTVLRDGKLSKLKVKMGNLTLGVATGKPSSVTMKIERLGITVSDIDMATQQVLGLHGGVIVGEITPGPATAAGIQAGDILIKAGRFELNSGSHLMEIVTKMQAGQSVPILVRRSDGASFVLITLPRQ